MCGDIETNTDTPACWSLSKACQRVIGGGAFGSIALTSVASKEGIDGPTVSTRSSRFYGSSTLTHWMRGH